MNKKELLKKIEKQAQEENLTSSHDSEAAAEQLLENLWDQIFAEEVSKLEF